MSESFLKPPFTLEKIAQARKAGKVEEQKRIMLQYNKDSSIARDKAIDKCRQQWPNAAKKWDELTEEEQKEVQPFTGPMRNTPTEITKLCDWFKNHNQDLNETRKASLANPPKVFTKPHGGRTRRRKTRRRKTRHRR